MPYSAVFDNGFEDMPRRVPDISKIRNLVGYTPTVHLDEIIQNVVAARWNRACPLRASPRSGRSWLPRRSNRADEYRGKDRGQGDTRDRIALFRG